MKGFLLCFVVAVTVSLLGCEGENQQEPAEPREDVSEVRTPPEIVREIRRDDQGNILADTFDVAIDHRGDRLTIALHTDLPDQTRLMISVTRLYHAEGDPEDYSISYFSESSTVGAWRAPRVVQLNHSAWRAELDDTRRIMAAAGDPFSVRSIAADVRVNLTVPINQPEPFARGNANLRGAAVEEGAVGRVIRSTVELPIPLDGDVEEVPWADPMDLHTGEQYRVSRTTPVVADPDPSDPVQAMAQMLDLPTGSIFRVIQKVERQGNTWYEVEVVDPEEVVGWINSVALIGQELRRID